jgi:Ca-activated chloride channel family protein
MEFASPYLLALALLALPVAYLGWRKSRAAYAVPSTAALTGLRPTARVRLARLLPVLRILAVVLLAVGIARPRVGQANAIVPEQGIDIVLAIDISGSMTANQFGPGQTRLAATRDVVRNFIKGRQNDRIGLVVFQRDALALSPPTLDYQALDSIVAKLDTGLLPDGTGIGIGLSTAVDMLRQSNAASRIVILLTDGEHNAPSISPLDAAQLAKALGIRVYTIGVQSPQTVPGSADTPDQHTLQAMADATGGQYYAADNPKALADVYTSIGNLETSHIGRERFQQFNEWGPWLVGAAGALLLLEITLRGTWLRRAPA